MNTSTEIDKLSAAIVKAQAAVIGAKEDALGQVGQQKYKYATLESVIAAIKPALTKNGLAVIQLPEPGEINQLVMTTRIIHESGQWLEAVLTMPLPRNDPQGYGSALTYAKRYSLTSLMQVPVEDDDGAAASHKEQEAKNGPTAPVQPPQGASPRYGEMTPETTTSPGQRWFEAKLKELGIDHNGAKALLGIQSFKLDMADKTWDTILVWTETAKHKATLALKEQLEQSVAAAKAHERS